MSNTNQEDVNNVDKIPTEQKGAFQSFIKSLASFTGDLSALTCPAFLLAPVSLIEYSQVLLKRNGIKENIKSNRYN